MSLKWKGFGNKIYFVRLNLMFGAFDSARRFGFGAVRRMRAVDGFVFDFAAGRDWDVGGIFVSHTAFFGV